VNIFNKKRLIILAIIQLVIVTISFIFYRKVSLLSYINISFYFSSLLLLTSLLLFTVHSGFYDVITRSFSYAFSRGHNKRRFDEIPRLSELVTIDEKPLLFYGLVNGLFMAIALLVFYM
jgi:hypothetical protein